jgi:hypothetical protein
LRSVGPIDTFNYSTIRMFSFFRSSAKPRRWRLKGQVKSTKQKDGSNRHNGNLQQLKMCGTTAHLQCMRLSVTSSYIKHDGCLLSLYSCETVLVRWTDEAKVKWLQLSAMAKAELRGMRLSVTSWCMKHDGCLLSQQFVTWLFCKCIINNTPCSIALFNLGPHSSYLQIEGSIYTV